MKEDPEQSALKKAFKGYWIPVAVVSMFERGLVSPREMVLLAMVDSLTNEEKGIGCYASNSYFAQKLRTTEGSISNMIARLKEVGLLEQVGFNGRYRYLIVRWPELTKTPESGEGSASMCTWMLHPSPHGVYRIGEVAPSELKSPPSSEIKAPQSLTRCGDRVPVVGRKASFWNEKYIPPNPARFCATSLAKLLTKHRKLMRPPSLPKWETEFRELISHVGDKEEVEATLVWYAKNLGKKYVPKAYSARAFRDKYAQIRDRMGEDPEYGPPILEPLDLDSTESKIYSRLRTEVPFPDTRMLPTLIRESLRNYTIFRRKLAALEIPNGVKFEHLKRLKVQLLENSEFIPYAGASSSVTFLVGWFRRVWESVRNWKGWNGSLSRERFVFSMEHPEFAKIGASESMKRFGVHGPWNQFQKLLNES